MNVSVTFDQSVINDDIDSFNLRISENLKGFIKEYTDAVTAEAQANYNAAEYTGDNIVVVIPRAEDDYGEISAEGTAVGFIEFGTGIENAEHPMADELGIHHGDYGFGFAKNGAWSYVGDKGTSTQTEPYKHKDGTEVEGRWWTHGVPASMALYNAYNNNMDKIIDLGGRLIQE